MKLVWYGTAALILSTNNVKIAFDPFGCIPLGAKRPESVPIAHADEFRAVHDVFVTHGHFDHIMHIPALYADTDAVIRASETPVNTLKAHGFPAERLELIGPSSEVKVGDIKVSCYKGKHCEFDKLLVFRTFASPRFVFRFFHARRIGKCVFEYKENGETLFFEVHAEGKRVQIMGSMGLDPDTDYPTGADALILPYQGKSDPVSEALRIIRILRPKRVLLDHYDDSYPPLTKTVPVGPIETAVRDQLGIPCGALNINETITL